MDLKECREQINILDEQIVSLLEKRMDAAVGIALYKKEAGLPVFDAVRERERLSTVKELAKNKEYGEYIANMYVAIMDETKKMEKEHMNED